MYASLVLMLMLSAFPRLDAAGSYVSFCAGRRVWLLGQVLTVLVITLGYCLLLACSILLGAERVHFHNAWSDTATLLSFSPDGFDPAFAVTRKMVKLMLPYPALMQIFVLLFVCSWLRCSSVQLAFTVLKNRQTGTLALLSAWWLYPHAGLCSGSTCCWSLPFMPICLRRGFRRCRSMPPTMHNFGYDLLPCLATSMLLLGGASAALLALAPLRMRHYCI